MQANLTRRSRTVLLAACLSAYCVFGLTWISLPGLQGDEMLFLNAISIYGRRMYVHASVHVFGAEIPTMVYSYVGTLKSWLWELVFLIWTPSVYSIRIPAVLLGGLALLLFYGFARRWYSAGTALLALALVAVDPSYIFTARLDWGPVLLSHVLMMSGLLLGSFWYQETTADSDLPDTQRGVGPRISGIRRWLLLGGAAFCFGLGLWDKATFVWFLAALAVSLLVLFPKQVLRCLRPPAIAMFVTCLLLGALPMLHYNVQAGREGTAGMMQLEDLGRGLLGIKIENLRLSLVGQSVYSVVGGGGEEATGDVTPPLAAAVLNFLAAFNEPLGEAFLWFFCLTVLLVPFLAGYRRSVLFPLLVALLMWVQMFVAKGGGVSVHHYVLAYPLPHLTAAAAACCVWRKTHRWARPAIASAVALVLLGQMSWDARYLQLFQLSGGRRYWTDAIYEIANFVEQRKPKPLAVMDWGFSMQLQLLTRGQVDLYEDFGAYRPDKLAQLVREPDTLFLFHAKGLESYAEGRQWLDEVAPRRGIMCTPVRNFFEREGRVVATIVQCRDGS